MTAEMIIRCMGANGRYAGYENMISCLEIIRKNPKKLVALEKLVYVYVAEEDGVSMNCLERRLDLLVTLLTKTAKPSQWILLELNPNKKPSVGEFLEAVTWYLRQIDCHRASAKEWFNA